MTPVYKMRCCGFVEIEDDLWFPECSFNALICMDKTKGIIKEIIKIPDVKLEIKNLYSEIFLLGNDLILVPAYSDKVVSYNLDSKEFFCASIKDYVGNFFISKYRAAYQYGNDIIMLPNAADLIIVYNHMRKEISTVEIKNIILLNELYPDRHIQFRPQFEVVDERIFIPYAEAGAILIFDLISKQAEVKIIEGLSGCDTINYDKGMFYLAAWNERKLYAIDMDFHIVNVYMDYPVGLDADRHIFAYSLLIEEKILFFPQLGNMIVSFDLKNKKIKEEMRFQEPGNDYTRTYIARINRKMITLLMDEDSWLSNLFYLNGDLYKERYCKWDRSYNNHIIRKYLVENHYFDILYENNKITMNILVDVLENTEKYNLLRESLKEIKIIGADIYRYFTGKLKF